LKLIYNPDCLLHETGNHPERKERLSAFQELPAAELPDVGTLLKSVHTRDYIKKVEDYSHQSMPLDGDTILSSNSYKAACSAVGLAILAAESGGFALGRPPGHHAYPDRGSGFCLFNSIAIATRHLLTTGAKVLILDIDGHQGDGTCDIFYHDQQVLFCSLHQYPAFPGTGWLDQAGEGKGKGFSINVPLPEGAGDDLFYRSLDFLLPIIKTFDPQVVAVSAGFDAHQHDPLLQLRFSLDGFYQCGKWLRENFDQVFAVLEGGYNLNVLAKAIKMFQAGYNQKAPTYPEAATSSLPSVLNTFDQRLDQLHQLQKEYWPV